MTEEEFKALRQAYFDRQVALLELPPEERSAHEATFAEFMTNKPNPPEHAEYMRRAADLYPDLPPGAQQNALHVLETLGKSDAKRYVANARNRELSNQRALMGTTLSAWRAKRSDEMKPYVFQGVRRDSPKRQREERERIERYNAYMAAGRIIEEQSRARQRKSAEKRLARELAAVGSTPAPRAKVDSTLVSDLMAVLTKGATYAEAAQALNLQPKGDKPHQTPAAQVRALVRDKIKRAHPIVTIGHDPARGGAVYRIAA